MDTIFGRDIRKGDRIKAEVTTGKIRVVEYIAEFDGDVFESWADHWLIERANPLPTYPFALIKVKSYTPIIREESGIWHHANKAAMETQYTHDALWEWLMRETNGEFDVLYEGYDGGYNE